MYVCASINPVSGKTHKFLMQLSETTNIQIRLLLKRYEAIDNNNNNFKYNKTTNVEWRTLRTLPMSFTLIYS